MANTGNEANKKGAEGLDDLKKEIVMVNYCN